MKLMPHEPWSSQPCVKGKDLATVGGVPLVGKCVLKFLIVITGRSLLGWLSMSDLVIAGVQEEAMGTEGKTKNRHSRRTIKLTPPMKEALVAQREIHAKLGAEYFFCTQSGCPVHLSNVRKTVWIPAMQRAGLPMREMKHSRHSFATAAISCGEDLLWVERVIGHRDIDMAVKTYSRYAANNRGTEDGSRLSALYGCALLETTGNPG